MDLVKSLIFILHALMLGCFFPIAVNAQNSPSKTILETDLIAAYNPRGLALIARGFHRHVYKESVSPLWDKLYIQGGFQFNVSPAFGRGGVHVEWLPIGLLSLRIQYDYYRFFGKFGSLLSFPTAQSPSSDEIIVAREGEESKGSAHRISIVPLLRAKIAKFIFLNRSKYALYNIQGDGPFYLEWEYDTLLKPEDTVFSNQTIFLYQWINESPGKMLLSGPYFEYVKSYGGNLTRRRLGVIFYYSPMETLHYFEKPRIFVQTGINLKDKNRENELYIVAGIGVDFAF